MKKIIKPVLIIVSMLVITAGIGGVIGLSLVNSGNRSVRMVPFVINNVVAEMRASEENRKRYTVTLDLYMELNSDIVSGLSPYIARRELVRNLNRLYHDDVAGEDGMEYVTTKILSWFSEDIDAADVGNVYISSMVTGGIVFARDPLEEDDDSDAGHVDPATMRTFRGLFSAMD